MEKIIGTTNYLYFRKHLLDYHLPEFSESLVKYMYYEDITNDKLKLIKFINITFYNKWITKYLPLMTNLETIFISINGILDEVKEKYKKIIPYIPNTIKILIIHHNSICYFSDLLNNLPPTITKIIVLESYKRLHLFKNKDIVEQLKNNFRRIPFGCKVYYCFDNAETYDYTKKIDLFN